MAANNTTTSADRTPPGFIVPDHPQQNERHTTPFTSESTNPHHVPEPLIGHSLTPMPPSLQEIMDAWAAYRGNEKNPEMLLDLLRAKSAEENRIIALANVQMIQMQATMLQIRAAVGVSLGSTPPPSTSPPNAPAPINPFRHPELLAQAEKTPQTVARVLPADVSSSSSLCESPARSRSRTMSRTPSLSHSQLSPPPVSDLSDDDGQHRRRTPLHRFTPYPPRIPTLPTSRRSPSPQSEIQSSPQSSSVRPIRRRVSLSPPPLVGQAASAVQSNNPAYLLSRKPLAQLVSMPSKSSTLYPSSRRRPTPPEEKPESLSSG